MSSSFRRIKNVFEGKDDKLFSKDFVIRKNLNKVYWVEFSGKWHFVFKSHAQHKQYQPFAFTYESRPKRHLSHTLMRPNSLPVAISFRERSEGWWSEWCQASGNSLGCCWWAGDARPAGTPLGAADGRGPWRYCRGAQPRNDTNWMSAIIWNQVWRFQEGVAAEIRRVWSLRYSYTPIYRCALFLSQYVYI